MGRLAVLARVGCDSDQHRAEDMDWQLHPLQVSIGSGYYNSYIGAIICNISLLVGFHFIMCGLGHFLARSHESSYSESLAILRLPSLNTMTYAFLLPGLALACGRVIFDPHRCAAWEILVAVSGLLFVVAAQVWCWWWLRVVEDEAELVPLESMLPMRNFVMGKEDWENVERDSAFVEQYGLLFDAYKGKYAKFIMVEQGMTIVVSLLASPESTNETFCSARNWAMVVSMFIFLSILIITKPFLSPLCNTLMILSSLLQFIGLLSMSIGFERGVSNSLWMYDLADLTLAISAFSGLVKTAYDGVLLFYMVCMGDLANELKTEKDLLKDEKKKLEALKDRLDDEAKRYKLDEPILETSTSTNPDEEKIGMMSDSELPVEPAHPWKGRMNMKHAFEDKMDLDSLRQEVARLKTDLETRRKRLAEAKTRNEAHTDHPWTKWDPGPTKKNILLPPSNNSTPLLAHTRVSLQPINTERSLQETLTPLMPLISFASVSDKEAYEL
eukprot:TRINITY_DN14233_c0_g1_i1.p1 TRINITY_DN14233_c0_g1~~TRINITY_DN14233_c0_g1_i1.p1  ORF type:complete len:523 (+),score=53.98 TRINITY_DN14233_c0_g1_i1:75-1571(+)